MRSTVGQIGLVAAAVVVVLFVWVGTSGPVETLGNPATTPSLPGWAYSWGDEFDGPRGAPPDASRWVADTGGDGWGNEELQHYSKDEGNAVLSGDGVLRIIAMSSNGRQCWYGPCEYTSARLTTHERFSQKYGRFEARIKLPKGRGLWPAFWMLGDDRECSGWPQCGEIDVMEHVGSEPTMLYSTVHGPGSDGYGGMVHGELRAEVPLAQDFHVYAVEWEPDGFAWSFDGRVYARLTRDQVSGQGREWVFDHSFYLLLNVAVGGKWPGPPDAATVFPQEMQVDYVRVFRRA